MDFRKAFIAPGYLSGKSDVIPLPNSAFNFLPFNIHKKNGVISVDPSFNLRTYAGITPVATYYVKPETEGGNDSASGADEAHAFKSIWKGLNQTGAHRVMVKAGRYYVQNYPTNQGWNSASPAVNVEVIGYGGRVVSSAAVNPALFTWSAVDSHYTSTYPYTFDMILDKSVVDANGDFAKLTKMTSIAEVDTTPGSWWYDPTPDTIYIRLSDNRAPDSDVLCIMGVANGRLDDEGVTYYIEGIDFEGDATAFLMNPTAGVGSKLFMKNCSFKYSASDLVSIGFGSLVILEDCIAARAGGDGFKCDVAGTPANLILINCIGRNNGLVGNTNSNGYSRHGPGNTVGINCVFSGNYGPGMADIDASKTWLLGCSGGVQAISTSTFRVGETSQATEMWLDSCVGGVDTSDINGSTGNIIHYRDFTPASPTISGTATVTPY